MTDQDCNQARHFIFLQAIDYSGEGTKTAQAIRTATQECFRADRGKRAGVPLAVVIITDGRSQDSRDLADATKRLYESAKQVFAIGVSKCPFAV